MRDYRAEDKVLRLLIKNEEGNARALLLHVLKLERRQGTFHLEDWEDWMRQYGVKR